MSKDIKQFPIKKVIFSVGVAHPLYNKPVNAYIESERCGYNGKCVFAHTVEPVYYPEDPKGIFVYDKDWNFLHYKTSPARSEVWHGFCQIVNE